MHTWTAVRFVHVVAFVFFVGGQLMLALAVAPAVRRHSTDAAMRAVARRFGVGSALALAALAATGAAMASHYSVWSSSVLQAKLGAIALIGALMGVHVARPRSRWVSLALAAASLVVVWLGVKLTYG